MSFLLLLGAGPVMGSYETARAPLALRAVRHRDTGKCDVLDLVEDAPESDEDLFLYRRNPDAPAGGMHVHERGRGGRGRRWLRTLSYEYVGPLDRDTGEVTEISEQHRAWWEAQYREALIAWAFGDKSREKVAGVGQGALFA